MNSYRFDTDKNWDTYTHDEFLIKLQSWADEFARVLRPGGSFAVFCADAYLSHLMDALTAAGLKTRRTLTWRKPNAVPVNRKTMMMSACEYVVLGVKGSRATFNSTLDLNNVPALTATEQVLVAGKAAAVVEKTVREALTNVTVSGAARPDEIAAAVEEAVTAAAAEAVKRVRAMYITTPAGEQLRGCVPNHVSFSVPTADRIHPTEKPVALLTYLIHLLSNPGDVILDPFGGSGSTGVAATHAQRLAVVVERDIDYFTKLSTRLETLNTPSQTHTSVIQTPLKVA